MHTYKHMYMYALLLPPQWGYMYCTIKCLQEHLNGLLIDKDMEGISILKTLCAFYTQYPHGGPSMPMPTPGGPAMYPGMSNQMPPAMPSGKFPLWKKSFYS